MRLIYVLQLQNQFYHYDIQLEAIKNPCEKTCDKSPVKA